jgi:cytoskeletal protein CcmA (bactofilin family)
MASDEATLIDAAATVEGQLSGRDARVLGRFKGDVRLEGALVLGAGARLEATVEAASAEIAGTFQGELHVGRLTLLDTARVEGSVEAKTLSIREGAVINGSVNSGASVAPPKPKPTPEPAKPARAKEELPEQEQAEEGESDASSKPEEKAGDKSK